MDLTGIGAAFTSVTEVIKTVGVWLGIYTRPEATRARQIRLQQLEQMKFDELQAEADKGDLDAQNEIRKRLANNGTTNK